MNPNDLFDLSTPLGKLSAVGLLAFFAVVSSIAWVREWVVPGLALKRSDARADRNLAGWEAATTQFERSLDLVDKMQSRRRSSDETR